MTRPSLPILIVALVVAGHGIGHGRLSAQSATGGPRLAPTAHPPVPEQPSLFWLVPDQAARAVATTETAIGRLARAARLVADAQYATALPLLRGADLQATPLAAYAQYYTALALVGLERFDEAAAVLAALDARDPAGVLDEAVPLLRADVATSQKNLRAAVDTLTRLSATAQSAPEEAWLRLGRAAEAAGERETALTAYRRVHYGFPLSAQAGDARASLGRLETPGPLGQERVTLELARAERLFSARRWAQARTAFEPLLRGATGDRRDLIALRLAESDYYLDRHRAARDALVPLLDRGPRAAEARFFHLTATRALGDRATYVTLARRLIADHPASEWAQDTLNGLASHYIIADENEDADRVFRELLRRFPEGRFADRAIWRSGWWAYRRGDFADTVTLFERGAAVFPRADYRPAWIYWAGRAREQMGDKASAIARYRLGVADYQNTYYGRLAEQILVGRLASPVSIVSRAPVASGASLRTEVRTDAAIRMLAAAGMYDDALREVQYAQRVWGDSPVLMATTAWLRYQQGIGLKATDRFNALRGAINTMRRAYPQFMAAGGETLPPDILQIIFPLDYWPLIKKYSDLHKLDPYLVAALMAQESTFTAEIRSHANAYGLMQIIPGTGRRVARQLGIRFTTASLTNPETNVRIGTKYFKDLIEQFGGAYFALAGYNAGPNRVTRWLSDAPGLPQDEFIDDIPYAETQTYVKRILGTAEDYRRLYGGGVLTPENMRPVQARRTD